MTNNFSTIKANSKSEKIVLIRMRPGRSIENSLAFLSGNTYTMTFAFTNVAAVKVNGTAYTLVPGAPSSSQYSFSETSKLLTINLGAALTTQIVVVYYYIFFTNDIYRYTYQDPEDSSTTLRDWQSRLIGFPEFQVSQKDIMEGFLSIGNITINLINNDNNFQQYLTDQDSFFRKELKIWQCLDSTDNFQKLFSGTITSLTIGREVNISVDNLFSIFQDNYYPYAGILSTGTFNTNLYPNIDPAKQNFPIPKIFSFVSRMIDSFLSKNGFIFASTGSVQLFYQFSEGYELTNVSYDTSNGTAVNRTWAACINSSSASTKTELASNIINDTVNLHTTDVADANYYRPGDNLSINGTFGATVYAIDLSTNKIKIWNPGVALANGDSIFRTKIPVVQIFDSDGIKAANLKFGTSTNPAVCDYRVTTDANGILNVIFNNNFEANYPASTFTTGLPANSKIIYRVYNHDDLEHATIAKEIIQNLGLNINSASITTANLTSIKTNFSIPYFGETSIKSAQSYLQDLLRSTAAILYIDNSFQIGYVLVGTVSAISEITETEFEISSFNQEIIYNDIFTDIYWTNKHGEWIIKNIDTGTILATYLFSPNQSSKAIYLHEISRIKELEVLTLTNTNTAARIIALITRRRALYNFKTKGINFSTLLGDDFILTTSKAIGTSGSKSVRIFSTNRKANETILQGIDIASLTLP